MFSSRTSKSLLVLAFSTFVAMSGYGLLVPVTPFLADALGADSSGVVWALGAYAIGQLLSAPLWGRLSDHMGRKAALAGSLALSAALYVLLWQVQSIVELGLVRFAAGLAAGNVAAAFAVAADLSSEQTRARHGDIGSGFGPRLHRGP